MLVCSYLVKENGIEPYKKHCKVLDSLFTDINNDLIIIGDYNFMMLFGNLKIVNFVLMDIIDLNLEVLLISLII